MVYRLSTVRSFIETETMSFNDSKNKTLLCERVRRCTSSTTHRLLMPSGLDSTRFTIMTTAFRRTKQTRKELEHYTLAREILQICFRMHFNFRPNSPTKINLGRIVFLIQLMTSMLIPQISCVYTKFVFY